MKKLLAAKEIEVLRMTVLLFLEKSLMLSWIEKLKVGIAKKI